MKNNIHPETKSNRDDSLRINLEVFWSDIELSNIQPDFSSHSNTPNQN